MPDNFRITAERMRDSSKLLHENSHFHNACYFAGYVCECYLKVIVENDSNLRRPRTYSHSITDLIYAITSASTIPAQFRPFLLNYAVDCASIISSWNPNSRYDDASSWDQVTSNQFQVEMEKCFNQVADMYISNVIL
jgi:HEPN domain-containing protein